jgi:hypothetical protein
MKNSETIKPNFQQLQRHFELYQLPKNPEKWTYSISGKQYDQIAELLNEYNITDKESIDNFCCICNWLNGSCEFMQRLEYQETKSTLYFSELYELKKLLEEETIISIGIKGRKPYPNENHKTKILTLKSESILNPIINVLKEKASIKWELLEGEKRKKGGQISLTNQVKKEYKQGLISYFKEFPQFQNLKKSVIFYFIGKFYAIAGIFREEADAINESYDSYRKYLIKSANNI